MLRKMIDHEWGLKLPMRCLVVSLMTYIAPSKVTSSAASSWSIDSCNESICEFLMDLVSVDFLRMYI
jgi:hypothetical protein